jgi:hypothetical protein
MLRLKANEVRRVTYVSAWTGKLPQKESLRRWGLKISLEVRSDIIRLIRDRTKSLRNEKRMQSIPQFVWIASPISSNVITHDPKVEQSKRSVMLLVVLFSFVFRPPFLLFSNSVLSCTNLISLKSEALMCQFLFFLILLLEFIFIVIPCFAVTVPKNSITYNSIS